MKHVTLFRQSERFAGWPANEGCWSFRGPDGSFEIVVGFQCAFMKQDVGAALHRIDKERARVYQQARSTDGGETWQIDRTYVPLGEATAFEGGVDFTSPNFAFRVRDGQFWVTEDRCRTWNGPYRLSSVDGVAHSARTEYQVYGPEECLLFLTGKDIAHDVMRPYCVKTTNGGQRWRYVSFIGKVPDKFAIMPSTVRLESGRLLCAIRRRDGQDEADQQNWIELWASDSKGESWRLLGKPVPDTGSRSGNPPSMVRMPDGRIVITYGYRSEPFGIRAVVGTDDGETWSDPIILRDDAGDRDLGYTRTVMRPDGKLFTAYYIDDTPEGERYIGGTIWEA